MNNNSNNANQTVPLSPEQQQQSEQLEQQIQTIEQGLQTKSNADLKQIADKLDTVERSMLLEKIDNELHTMKDTIVKPGDAATTAAAGATTAAEIQNTATNTP